MRIFLADPFARSRHDAALPPVVSCQGVSVAPKSHHDIEAINFIRQRSTGRCFRIISVIVAGSYIRAVSFSPDHVNVTSLFMCFIRVLPPKSWHYYITEHICAEQHTHSLENSPSMNHYLYHSGVPFWRLYRLRNPAQVGIRVRPQRKFRYIQIEAAVVPKSARFHAGPR